MLRLVLVVAQSGIVLYKKEFQRLVAQVPLFLLALIFLMVKMP